MKKKKKLLLFLLIFLLGAGALLYIFVFYPQTGKDVYVNLNSFTENQKVVDVDKSLSQMEQFLKNRSRDSGDEQAYQILKNVNYLNSQYKKIEDFTLENVLWITNANNFKRQINKSLKNTISAYNQCYDYLSKTYLKNVNHSDGDIVDYIKSTVCLLDNVFKNKNEYFVYLCLMQGKGYINCMQITELNCEYLTTCGYLLKSYYNSINIKVNTEEPVTTFSAENQLLKKFINKINVDSSSFYNNRTKVLQVYDCMQKIDMQKLVQEYFDGNASAYLNEMYQQGLNNQAVQTKYEQNYTVYKFIQNGGVA